MRVLAEINLRVAGLGIILYSPSSAAHIADGEDYLQSKYWQPEDVAAHVRAGTIVGLAMGTPGDFLVCVRRGAPTNEHVSTAEFAVRLALRSDGLVVVRDLYDLMEWSAAFDPHHAVEVDAGWYRVTVTSSTPPSGVLGDNQRVDLFLESTDVLPTVHWDGVPQLCD